MTRRRSARCAHTFVTVILPGNAPPELFPWFRGAPLTALPKGVSGVCPIAVGEGLRRHTNSCATAKDTQKAAGWFRPLHFGKATRNCTEGVVEGNRHEFDSHIQDKKFKMPSADLRNALNVVSRAVFMERMKKDFPCPLPYDYFTEDVSLTALSAILLRK